MADQSSSKPSRCWNKLRVIGRIRGFTDEESKSLNADSKAWITVRNPERNDPSGKSTILLEAQSASRNNMYELDYCYGQEEETELIYSRELKPLISKGFDGNNVSVIALGARGSGKTHSVQGSQENPGLAVKAMSDILVMAGELGKSVYVSLYELTHDHAYDVLDPKHPEVQVMDDGHGKINLKGLSKVAVKTMSDFYSIYFSTRSVQNTQKGQLDQPRNYNLKGLMIHICADGEQKTKLASKINFVDLAGYEDPKKSSSDGIKLAEINRRNKSLYGLLNVISALKANELRLPYRESKITRILQDSLGCTSHILLLACLNPLFCQDTISSLCLVSRTYRSTNQLLTDSTNRALNTTKVKDLSSLKSGRTISASLSAKKQFGDSYARSEKKSSSIVKGRKLFNGETRIGPRKLNSQSADMSAQKSGIPPELALVVSPFSLEEDQPVKAISEVSKALELEEDKLVDAPGSMPEPDNTLFEAAVDDKAIVLAQKDVPPHDFTNHQEASFDSNLDEKVKQNSEAASSSEEGNTLQKKDELSSPPLSEKIKELAYNLKSFSSSTPYRIKMSEETVAPYNSQVGQKDTLEPQTPLVERGIHCTPNGTFGNRSTGVKHSLVQEYLKFLNSASKEELKGLKGIGEKRATYILELREESPEPFKNLDDLQNMGLSAKQVKGMMKQVAGELFN